MYTYIQSEPGLYTVGFYTPGGEWQSDSDHSDREIAAKRVNYLNGGMVVETDDDVDEILDVMTTVMGHVIKGLFAAGIGTTIALILSVINLLG